jgi:hypothetical protein
LNEGLPFKFPFTKEVESKLKEKQMEWKKGNGKQMNERVNRMNEN